MTFQFVVDKTVKGKIYPALAYWEARPYTQGWREFGSQWPWTTPLRIEEYCREHNFVIEVHTLQEGFPHGCWYPICLGFFDFTIDYLSLLPSPVKSQLISNKLRLLFMYHEGDNPMRIKQRLDALCQQHNLPSDCYLFVSANSKADHLPNFVTFHDFELWYHQRNKDQLPCTIQADLRTRDFLCLSRMHKSWRAAITADLVQQGLLDDSEWSYCKVGDDDDANDNPLQIDLVPQLRYNTAKFLRSAPYYCDTLTDQQRNDHACMTDAMANTRCNIVLESQFDVDQSGGVFLTEKTFKAIKHGQMFFIAGAAGSLSCLRNLGYRVFDDLFDNGYDEVQDHTERWLYLRDSIAKAKSEGLHALYQKAQSDLEHNQRLFSVCPWQRLNTLSQKLEQHVSQ